jgi:hypothetical protein
VTAYIVALISNLAAVGLAGLVDHRLDGRPAQARDGWSLMRRRLPQVAGWALLVVVVGIPARILTGWGVDQVAAVLLGFGWAVISFFAIPAIALAGDGPIRAGARSLGLVGRQWGSQVVGMVYVWVRPVVFIGVPGALLLAAGIVVTLEGRSLLGWILGAGGVVAIAFAYLLVVTARAILCVALYRFAQDQELPPEFNRATLDRVLRPPAPRTVRIVRRLDNATARRVRERLQRLIGTDQD